jgi:hypothetical protein
MSVRILIDSIVRQTTVLIAQLATSGGLRAPLAHNGERLYRATTKAEQLQMGKLADASGLEELLWAFIYREGPVGRDELAEFAASNPERVDETLVKLAACGKIRVEGQDAERRYRAERLEVLLDAEVGWEAAVFDHYRALVQTICQRLTQPGPAAHARVGGSTFTLDVWDGHPHADEAYAVLSRFRAIHAELFERIERHNAEHGRPAEYDQVVIYFGQHVVPRRDADEVGS